MDIEKIIKLFFVLAFLAFGTLIRSKKKRILIDKKVKLLPYLVRFAGGLISLVCFAGNFIQDINGVTLWKDYWQLGIVTGFLLICFSRERIEDEMIDQLRQYAVFISFFAGIIFHLIILLLNILGGGKASDYNSIGLVVFILMIYLIIFHIEKRKLKHEEHLED
jgi:hypothetical protein